MKTKNILFIALSLSLVIVLSCKQNTYYSQEHKGVMLQNAKIELLVTDDMQFIITGKDNGKQINDSTTHSSFTVEKNGVKVNFKLQKNTVEAKQINDQFGKGTQYTLNGIAQLDDKDKLTQKILISLYDNFPNTMLVKAKYINKGENELSFNKYLNAHLLVDASRMDPELQPYAFGTYQGSAIKWGKDYIFRLEKDFSQENYMGEKPDTKMGGGIPVIDIWNKHTGLALAHIETEPRLVSFPVEVKENGKVSMALTKEENISLKPGDAYETINTAIILHEGDFYDALKSFSSLMAAQGLKMQEFSPECYEPIWCGWGYRFDFTPEQIFGTLPKVKEMGIEWVVIDDRWMDTYGDWNPREDIFPGGEEQIKNMVDSLHDMGYKVKLWWLPTAVQGDLGPFEDKPWIQYDWGLSEFTKNNYDLIIMNEDGSFSEDSRHLWNLCPALPEVQEYVRALTEKFIHDWDFDGHKMDAYYVVPPCYNPAHDHADPAESYQQLPVLFKIIYETTKKYKPDAVVELCNCGVPQDFYQSIWTNQPVTSDPSGGPHQVRNRIKAMKALWGADAPVYADQVEFIGDDFASGFGPGGILGTKFTWPGGLEEYRLTPEKEKHWKKWFHLYNEKMLSKGTYLNLYDIYYDKPETHVVKKENTLYYAFYADEWHGEIELRGLEKNQEYNVYDYVNDQEIGAVSGNDNILSVEFKQHLLIECKPIKQ